MYRYIVHVSGILTDIDIQLCQTGIVDNDIEDLIYLFISFDGREPVFGGTVKHYCVILLICMLEKLCMYQKKTILK